MDSPPAPASPSPSTPSSGDEDEYDSPGTAVQNQPTADAVSVSTSPVPKRRAVATTSSSGAPSSFTRSTTGHGLRSRGGDQGQQGIKRTGTLPLLDGGGGGSGGGQKEELVDVAYMNELRQRKLSYIQEDPEIEDNALIEVPLPPWVR
ncbi:hypothetical protein FRB93_007700 [Tulasnella sp. JGI-2019a]|nr:hypothetical protein FRB93_007700 [Tulasnella sp. JGI-2019a]